MNWTDCKTIPSLLVGTYVCVHLVRVHTDYSWYFPCYTAFGIFKGCRNDLNAVMRGSLKSRTSVPISSFSTISNRQTIFSLNHRALLRQSFHFWTAGLLLGSLNKSNQDFFFLNCWSQAKADSGSYNWQLSINLTMAHKQHATFKKNSQFSCTSPLPFQMPCKLPCGSVVVPKRTAVGTSCFVHFSPPIYWQGNWGQQLSLRGEHINIYGEYHWAEGEFVTLEL